LAYADYAFVSLLPKAKLLALQNLVGDSSSHYFLLSFYSPI